MKIGLACAYIRMWARVSSGRVNPLVRHQSITAWPLPLSTVMSSASTVVCCRTTACAGAAAAPGKPAARNASNLIGWVSRKSRCSVQPPPDSTLVGTAGSGTIQPSEPETTPW